MTLAGVTDPEMDALVYSVSALNASLGTFIITNAALGEFTYDPPAGCSTTPDTLTYEVTDTFSAGVTGTLIVTATDCIWYVDNSHTPNGDGTSVNPFNKLSDGAGDSNPDDGEDASTDSEDIFVLFGDGTTNNQDSGITLNNDQRLLGQGVELTARNPFTLPASGPPGQSLFPAGNHPRIQKTGDTDVQVNATAGDRLGNEVRGLALLGGGIFGVSVSVSATFSAEVLIADNMFGDATVGPEDGGIVATNGGTGTLTLAINNNTFVNVGDAVGDFGVSVANTAGGSTFITSFTGNVFDGIGSGIGVSGTGVSMTGVIFDANPSDADFTGDTVAAGGTSIGASGSPVGATGVILTNVEGDVDFGLASGVLDVFATDAGLQANGFGPLNAAAGTGFRITVPDGSTIAGNVTALAAPLTEAPTAQPKLVAALGGAMDLDPLTAMFGTSGGSGVTLLGESVSFVQIEGDLFFNSTSALTGGLFGDVFSLTNSDASIDYDGTIVDDTGFGITSSGNGTAANNDTVNFNGTVDLGMGAALTNAAVEMTGNDPTFTINFNAALDIVTNGADGIFGTGSGMLTTVAGSTIDTTDGTAININGDTSPNDIDFGPGSLNFDTIMVNNSGSQDCIFLLDFSGTANLGVVTLNTNFGAALTARNGGTLTTQPGSTINNTSDPAFSAQDVDFGFGSLHFDSVNANDSANAVTLNNTSGRVNIMGGTIDSDSEALLVQQSPSSLELILHNTTLNGDDDFLANFATGSLCLSMAGNTLAGVGTNINLNQAGGGAINVVQGSKDILSAVNGGATVIESGTIGYGAGCLTAPMPGDPFSTPPVANNDPSMGMLMVDEGMFIDIDVVANDTDADIATEGDVISLISVTAPTAAGTAMIISPTTVRFTGDSPIGMNEVDTFMYTITDKAGLTATAQVTVTVNNLPEPPVIATSPLNMETVGNTRLDLSAPPQLTAESPASSSDARGPPARSRGGSRPSPDAGTAAPEPKSHGGIPAVQVTGTLVSLAGITDPDGPGFTFSVPVPSPGNTTLGGIVTITDTMTGAFIYDPPAGCPAGPDSFTYTVTDGTSPVMGTVSIALNGCIWFVDNSHSPNGVGTSATPFDNLADAATNSSDGEDVFVLDGDGTATNQDMGFSVDNNQRFLGEGVALQSRSAFTLPTGNAPSQTLFPAGTHPLIDNTGGGNDVDVVSSGADLTGIEIRGLQLIGSTHGINVSSTATDSVEVLIENNIIGTTGGSASGPIMNGLNAVNTSTGDLAIAFNNNTINTVGSNGVNIDGSGATGETFVTSFEGNTFLGVSGSEGVAGTGVFMNTVTFASDADSANFTGDTVPAGGTTVGASGTPVGTVGMSLTTVSGDVNFGMASGVLSVFATDEGLRAIGSGVFNAGTGMGFQMTVPDGSTIAGGGAALAPPLSEAPVVLPKGMPMPMLTGAAVNLDPMTAFFGTMAGSGVTLLGESAAFDQIVGALFFNSTSALTGGSLDVFSLTGSNASIDYDGTIVDDSGSGITVANNGSAMNSDTLNFNGNVNLGTTTPISDGSGGFQMTGNDSTFAVHFSSLSSLNIMTDASNAATPGIVGTAGGTLDIDAGMVTTTGESAIDIDGINFGSTVTFSNVTSNGTGMGDPGIDLSNVSGTFNGGIANIGTTTPNNAIGIRVMNSSATVGFTSVTIDNTTGTGIEISGSSGSFDVTGNTTIDVGSSTGIDVLGSTTNIGFGGALTITNAGTAINIDGTGGAPVDFDVTGIANLGVGGTNNHVTTGISLANVGTGATFSFTTVNIGTATSMPAMTGLSLMSNTGAPIIEFTTALNVTNSGGPGIFAMSAGGITSAGGIINTANGAGIDATGPTFAATFSVVSGGSGGVQRGINLEDIGGMLTMTAGTIPTGTTMEAFRVHGGNATVSYGGGITNGADNGVLIEDVLGGSVTLSGAIDENGTGIFFNNNTGATINFSGSLDIDTGGNTGFTATNGGTVNVTGTGSNIGATTPLTDTAVNITDTTIGGSGVTFESIDISAGTAGTDSVGIILDDTGAGTFTVTGDGTTTFGGNGSGGTIENITDTDAITFNNTDGLVTFQNMIIQDIADSSDGSDPIGTRTNVDGIHGQTVDGGLKLQSVTMRRFSDNAVNGGAADGISATSWTGLEIRDSLLENSNRYHVGGFEGPSSLGDDNQEGLVRIRELKGTLTVVSSTLRRGAQLLDLFSTQNGADLLDATIQTNIFEKTVKEFTCGSGTVNVGKSCIRLEANGAADVDFRVGDPAESTSGLGNTFTDCGTASVRLARNSGSGSIDAVISQNTFEVLDHLTGPSTCSGGTLVFDFPQGGVFLDTGGSGTYEAIVSNNTFNQVMHAGGNIGQLSITVDGSGRSDFRVQGNTFDLPWDGPVRILADGNSADANMLFGGPNPGDPNTYNDGLVGTAPDAVCPGLLCPTQSPFNPYQLNVRNGGRLDIKIQNEVLPQHDDVNSTFANSFDASMNASGGTLNVHVDDSVSPDGYRFTKSGGAGTFELFSETGCPNTAATIIDNNGNTGGNNSDATDPPVVVTSGTIGCTTTAPTPPVITIP